jgi:hypothetical protein
MQPARRQRQAAPQAEHAHESPFIIPATTPCRGAPAGLLAAGHRSRQTCGAGCTAGARKTRPGAPWRLTTTAGTANGWSTSNALRWHVAPGGARHARPPPPRIAAAHRSSLSVPPAASGDGDPRLAATTTGTDGAWSRWTRSPSASSAMGDQTQRGAAGLLGTRRLQVQTGFSSIHSSTNVRSSTKLSASGSR